MATVYIALGSNIGVRAENIRTALALLEELGVEVRKTSSLYETEPVDYLAQDWFLNAVLEAETTFEPHDLLNHLRDIEQTMGSQKPFAKGPRLIDLDLLLYGDQSISTLDLQVPHPRMLRRNFVLVPLVEIAPDLYHPSWGCTATQMLAKCLDTSEVRKLA